MPEKRRLRELVQELKSSDKLFDSDLFLAYLKQPRFESNKDYNVSSDKDLEAISDMLRDLSSKLMELEGFFREKLANTPYIKYEDVPKFVDELNEVVDNIDSAIEITDKIYMEIPTSSTATSISSLIKANSNNDLRDIINAAREFLTPLKSMTEDFMDYLVTIYNLFSDNDKNVLEGHDAPTWSGGKLLKALSKTGLENLAFNYVTKVGMAVFVPQTTDIDLRSRKLKDLSQQLKSIYNDAFIKFEPYTSDEDNAVDSFLYTISSLDDSLHEMIKKGVSTVRACIELRSKLEPLGYKPPSRECAFYLTRDVIDRAITRVGSEIGPYDVLNIEEIPSELNFPLFFNDIAYATHRVAEMLIYLNNYIEKLVGNLGSHILKLDKCSVQVYSNVDNGALLKFVTAWLNTECALIENRWVAPGDRDYLGGYIISDTNAWFRVGSAYNHATHVRKDGDTWIMRYYDTDKPVNETLARLWGAVPNTEVEVLDDGVLAKTKDERVLPFLGALLGFATSMDINLEYLGGNIRDRMIKLAEKVSPQLALIVKKALGA